MGRTRYTAEQQAEALAVYAEKGPAEAGRRTGIPPGTIASWANRAGVSNVAPEQTVARIEAAMVTLAERKTSLAENLMADIERLRRQLWAPTTERKAMVVANGGNNGASVEIVDIDRDQPTFSDQKTIMTALAIAVDKVQILTGEATERIEHRHSSPIDDELAALAAELENAG